MDDEYHTNHNEEGLISICHNKQKHHMKHAHGCNSCICSVVWCSRERSEPIRFMMIACLIVFRLSLANDRGSIVPDLFSVVLVQYVNMVLMKMYGLLIVPFYDDDYNI